MSIAQPTAARGPGVRRVARMRPKAAKSSLGRSRHAALRALLAACFIAASAWPGGALGAGEDHYSDFERRVIAQNLAAGESVDPAPQGKLISRIDIVRLDVLDDSDPVPDFLNVLHVTTRERVIRRELLFDAGQRYSALRADESARNLRNLRQLSLVLIVPVAAPDGALRVLIVTKDVWSLRLNSNFEVADGKLNYLLLNPSEENIFGTHARMGGVLILNPSTYSTGLLLGHGRIAGTRLSGTLSGNLVFNRDTAEVEGSFGSFTYGLPQYSAEQHWSFISVLSWSDGLSRVGRREANGERVTLVYGSERYVGASEVTRSFGLKHKLDLTLGVEADRRAYQPRLPPDLDPALVADFIRTDVPISDTRISPYAQLESYESRFLKVLELETLGLQEDYRLGHVAQLRVYPASRSLGSSRSLLGVFAGLSYSLGLGDGLVRAIVASSIEVAADKRQDASFEGALRIASPRLGVGRLILDGYFGDRYENYLNRRFAIGGEGRLRGYSSGNPELSAGDATRGASVAVANAEFRTAGVEILSAQCGLAAFYDVGDAADQPRQFAFKQSAGVGLRILFPQANRIVFRADWAFPLTAGYASLPGAVFVTFGQAFQMPDLTPPGVVALATTER